MHPRSTGEAASLRISRAIPPRLRCRSFCFLEHESSRWTVFLVTYAAADRQWRGYFTFRSAELDPGEDEIRTADLFVEVNEEAVDARARGLGRPLLEALLESAVHTYQKRAGRTADYVRWFRDLLSRQTEKLERDRGAVGAALTYDQLRSLYESYRTDQVAHFIALVDAAHFRQFVEQTLSGDIDFGARDRFQHAMRVVQKIERHLPLPPFEVWVVDYVTHAPLYQDYSRQLQSGELPD